MHQDAFIEYATRYLLIPGQCSTAQEIINAIGMTEPLPKLIADLINLTDHIEHKSLVLTESDPLLIQWNPFTGMSPIISEHAFGVGAFDDHRWLQSMHNSGIKVLYDLIHECVHAIWAAFGLCGGLKLLPIHKHEMFHTLAEACAVYISDIEGHETLIESDFFKNYWPSGAHRSHAISYSALQSLKASGLSRSQRADWLFSIYLDGERSLPTIPDSAGLKAEALAFLIEESNYSEKIDLYTTPQWLRYYWGRTALAHFIEDFIPSPHFILPCGQKLSDFESLRSAWREVLNGGFWFMKSQPALIQSQLKVQRKALKVCELISVFSERRLELDQNLKDQALDLLYNTRKNLHLQFKQLVSGSIRPQDSFNEEIDEIIATLTHNLSQVCGPILILKHPYLDALPFADACPKLKETADQPRDLGELIRCFTLISQESLSAYKQLKEHQEHHQLANYCEAIYLDAQTWIARLNLHQDDETYLKAQQSLNEIASARELPLVYPLIWHSAAPFIEPLIGFRYR